MDSPSVFHLLSTAAEESDRDRDLHIFLGHDESSCLSYRAAYESVGNVV